MKIFLSLAAMALILNACTSSTQVSTDINVKEDFQCANITGARGIVNGTSIYPQDADSKRAVLLVMKKGDKNYTCTGAVISNRVILTAAHCVQGAEKNSIAAIFHPDVTCASGYSPKKVVLSVDMLIHPDYKGETSAKADLALVKLSSFVPAEYPVQSLYDGQSHLSSDDVLMLGYGVTKEDAKDSLFLRKTIKSYNQDSYTKEQNIVFNQANQSGGICSGDSGGPVYVQSRGQYKIIGVNSVVSGKSMETVCHEVGIAIYTPYYSNWIQQNLNF